MTAVKLIVGLGNPGPEYDQTRHNAGALFVERLAAREGVSLSNDRKYFGLVGKFSHQGEDIRLLIPTTYMNRSGQSVAALANFFRIPIEAILVAHDELDMPPGVAKLKQGGGHGGHNGLRDISKATGTKDYLRVRVGVGRPPGRMDTADYVLRPFGSAEAKDLPLHLDRAADAVERIIDDGLTAAQNAFHSS